MRTLVVWADANDVPAFFIVEDKPVPTEFHNAYINCDECGDRINDFFFDSEGKERYKKHIDIQTGYFDAVLITGIM